MEHAARRYRNEIVATLQANWTLWLPAMFVAFKLVPTHLRVPYVSAVSFVWTSIMSAFQGSFESGRQDTQMKLRGLGEKRPLVVSAAVRGPSASGGAPIDQREQAAPSAADGSA